MVTFAVAVDEEHVKQGPPTTAQSVLAPAAAAVEDPASTALLAPPCAGTMETRERASSCPASDRAFRTEFRRRCNTNSPEAVTRWNEDGHWGNAALKEEESEGQKTRILAETPYMKTLASKYDRVLNEDVSGNKYEAHTALQQIGEDIDRVASEFRSFQLRVLEEEAARAAARRQPKKKGFLGGLFGGEEEMNKLSFSA